MSKRLVEIEDELLDAARRLLGTETIKDTVNTALRENVRAADRRDHVDRAARALRCGIQGPPRRGGHGRRMALTPASWLVDKSVLARIDLEPVAAAVLPRIRAGEMGVALVTELEVGFSARSASDYRATREEVMDHLLPVSMPARAEQRARELQWDLVERGHHRDLASPTLLLAAIADIEHLPILHYDSDFDLVADVTGQPAEWIVAPAEPWIDGAGTGWVSRGVRACVGG